MYKGILHYEMLGINTWIPKKVELSAATPEFINAEAIAILERETWPIRNIELEMKKMRDEKW